MHPQAEWFRKRESECTSQRSMHGSETLTRSCPGGSCDYGGRRFLVGPTERRIEQAVRDQLPNMGDALEARPFEVFENEADLLVGFVQLYRSLACIPLGLELGQHLADLAAIHAIAALVRASIGGVLDPRIRHCF